MDVNNNDVNNNINNNIIIVSLVSIDCGYREIGSFSSPSYRLTSETSIIYLILKLIMLFSFHYFSYIIINVALISSVLRIAGTLACFLQYS